MPDGFARLLSYGIAQYHGIHATSDVSPTAGRVIHLKAPKRASSSPPELTCAEYVFLLQEHVDEGVTAAVVRSYLAEVE